MNKNTEQPDQAQIQKLAQELASQNPCCSPAEIMDMVKEELEVRSDTRSEKANG